MTRTIYIGVSSAMFVVSLVIQTTPKYLDDEYSQIRLVFFMSWSAFGVLPCIHWIVQNGGFTTPYVFVSVPIRLIDEQQNRNNDTYG